MYTSLIIGAGSKGCNSDMPGSGNEHKFLSFAHPAKRLTDLKGFTDIDKNKSDYASFYWDTNESLPNEVDIVIITTNDDQHIDSLVDALAYDPKIVVCEKPIFTDLGKGQKILKTYKELNIPIVVNYTRRYTHKWKIIREQIKTKDFGEFVEGYLYFNGGWEHTASHFIDLVRYFGLDINKIRIKEVDVNYKWIFQWSLIFKNNFLQECISKDGINPMYNYNTLEVLYNAIQYLNGKEKLICDANEAYESLKLTLKLKDDYYASRRILD